MEDGGECCSVGLELHLLGGCVAPSYLEDGGECCSDDVELHPIWRMEENVSLLIWSSMENGGEVCSDDLEDELLHLIWRMEENVSLLVWRMEFGEDELSPSWFGG